MINRENRLEKKIFYSDKNIFNFIQSLKKKYKKEKENQAWSKNLDPTTIKTFPRNFPISNYKRLIIFLHLIF